MMKRLKDNLTSSYLEAANWLNPKKQRKKIVAYVESYDDVFFWR
ncbi:MAG: ABC transporter ATP-binding protein, partial [Prevotella sp.]